MTTFETWDNVPVTVNSGPEKTKEESHIAPDAERIEIGGIPAMTPPGTVVHTELDGQSAILIGTAGTGYTTILCPTGWATLQRWKLTTLRVSRGLLYAADKGRAGGFVATRFLLGASGNHIICHRNGNPFDIRLSNIVAIPRGLIRQAKIEAARGQRVAMALKGGSEGL
jgi:hypothetical protein